MLLLGIGAALQLLLFGLLPREAMIRARRRMMPAGGTMKPAFDTILVQIGIAVSLGIDKSIEAKLVVWSPTSDVVIDQILVSDTTPRSRHRFIMHIPSEPPKITLKGDTARQPHVLDAKAALF